MQMFNLQAKELGAINRHRHDGSRRAPTRALRTGFCAVLALLSVAASSQPDLSNLITLLNSIPEGSWIRVNTNNFSDSFAPADLLQSHFPSATAPSALINAWSSFAWDSNRGDLIIFGGGHANYTGNEIYRWHGTSQLWERASLPSEIVLLNIANDSTAIDGAMNAPVSAHTYDNQEFLPNMDRFITFGGAAYNGGNFKIKLSDGSINNTGPYFWDPSRGDPNKVGGTTGSHVQTVAPHPEVLGGNMWQNRDIFSGRLPDAYIPDFVNTQGDYTSDKGIDTVYQTSHGSLFKYQVTNLNDSTTDTWEPVGAAITGIYSFQGAGAYDPSRKLFLRTGTAVTPLVYWDLRTPGPGNPDTVVTSITDLSGTFAMNVNCGLDFEPVRNVFLVWGGGGKVWKIVPPATPATTGWTVTEDSSPVGVVPDVDVGTGVLGKFKYISNLHAFMALQNKLAGNIWLYKPVGWTAPGPANNPPTVTLNSPANGATSLNVPSWWLRQS